jgi:hypothetical protein
MKAATGELNLTLITIIALGAVLTFWKLLWPTIQEKIQAGWDDIEADNSTGYVEKVETDLF